ncbi:MAG: DinB family protein [Caldilineaceae bacterium]
MLDANQLADAFDRNFQLIKRQCDGLTHEDSLLQTPFNINSLNWIIGHITDNRDSVLRLLGAEPAFGEEGARYRRNSEPIKEDGEGILKLDHLLTILEEGQARISATLRNATPEALAHEVERMGRKQSIGQWLFFLHFHDTYHTGQTELLRQVAGKNDKII